MPIAQRQYPVRFTSIGLVDAYDATDKFPGACRSLTNLIFDQSNPEIMVSRPGVGSGITDFTGFNTPGIVSVQITIGNVTYGMISTARNANKDEPFAYNNSTGSFITVSGVLNANCPTTQAGSGPWTPPTMANIGVYIIVTHPGFPGAGTMFGYFDITTPSAPAWTAGDTGTNGLPSVPVAVQNFNNRAYFACGNTTPYTDVLSLTRTSSSQALTIGDQAAITAMSGLPIQTTSSGVVQALLIWKAFQTWQVTGDAASSSLAQNYISLTIGTSAPRSVAQSPLGTYFASFSGPCIVDLYGILRPVIYRPDNLDPDIKAPWLNATTPSRMAAGYTANIYRICMETTLQGATSTNDYWFDEHRRRWTGPHDFPYDCVSQYSNYNILCSNANPGKLFKSEIYPNIGSTYLDNGSSMMSTIQTSTFPKTGHMVMKQVVESTIELASAGSPSSYQITALDDQDNTLNTCQITVLPSGTLWGTGVWGGFTWASAINRPATYSVPWTLPLVFKKMALYITIMGATTIAIGTFYARYQEAGYTNRLPVP